MHKCKGNENKQTYIKEYFEAGMKRARAEAAALWGAPAPHLQGGCCPQQRLPSNEI